jgi:hypothetical protein
MNKNTSKAKFMSFATFFVICYQMSLLVGMLESSDGRSRSFPLSI